MKAIVYTDYGPPDVLHVMEIEKPSPGDREILVRVHASSVNFGDLIARNIRSISSRNFHMPSLFLFLARLDFGLLKPKRKILGNEFAGEIADTGKEVKRYHKGDQVFGYLGQKMGAYAEYLCIPEDGVLDKKPVNMNFEEAAVVPMGAIMALYILREKGNIEPGQKVLVNGASGSIGSAAVQLIKNHFNAEVTGVCSTLRQDYVKSLGADKIIDYTKEDFTKNGEKYDLIFDVLGKSTFSSCKGSLTQNGRYLLASFKLRKLLQMLWTSISGSKKVICAIAPGNMKDLHEVKKMIESGKLKTIIDKRFSMVQAAKAHSFVEEGKAKGKVVITMT